MLSAVARQQAYEAAGRALELNPQVPRAYAVLGILQMLDGEIDEAIESVERAVALDPNGADAKLNLAIVLTFAGQKPGSAGGHGASAATRSKAESAGLRLLWPGALYEPPIRRGSQGPSLPGATSSAMSVWKLGHGQRATGPEGGCTQGGRKHFSRESPARALLISASCTVIIGDRKIWIIGLSPFAKPVCRNGVTVSTGRPEERLDGCSNPHPRDATRPGSGISRSGAPFVMQIESKRRFRATRTDGL